MTKRLLFIVPTFSRGGQERFVSRLSKEFKGFEKFLLLFYRDRIDYEFQGKIINLNLPLPSQNLLKIYKKILSLIIRILKVKNIKKEIMPDIALSFGPEADVVNVLSNFFLKKKPKLILSVRIVESVHFEKYPLILRIYYFLIMKLIYRKGDLIIANSEEIKEDLIKNFSVNEEKIKVIYNPYDIENIRELAEESLEEFEDLFKNHRVIIGAGRLALQKNFELLIRAFAFLEKEFTNLRLVILGEGELLNELKKLSSDLGIENKVHFLGFQKNPFKFFKNAEIFVLSSLYEGFPNVLLEAMVVGLPVIATNCPGAVKEILSLKKELDWKENMVLADFGIIVENNNLSGLIKAIKMLLENQELREFYHQKSLLRSQDFEIKKIINQWLNLFQSLI